LFVSIQFGWSGYGALSGYFPLLFRPYLNDEKEKKRPKPDIDDRQKVARPNIFGVILQQDCPGLRSGLVRTNAGDIFLNGVFGDSQPQLE